MGVLQVHFSGGEPTARRDLLDLVRTAREHQLYSNLITSGVALSAASLAALREAGLDHVQLSFQDAEADGGDRIGGMPGGHRRKLEIARLIREAGFPLTVNFVVHRQNLARLPQMLALGEQLGAGRIEIAHVQYYGWALVNRSALMPMVEQVDAADIVVAEARARLRGAIVIDYVTPDYHAAFPKACMGGWARQFLNVTPTGRVLPCHAAETLTGAAIPFGTGRLPRRNLGQRLRLHALPRHRPGCPSRAKACDRPRSRLGRLPLSGLRPDGRGRRH